MPQADAGQLQALLLAARQHLKANQPDRALELAHAAAKLDPHNALAFFVAGGAHGALGQHSAAAAAFRTTAGLTADAAPGSQRHNLHCTASENLLLEAERALPPGWLAALNDETRMATLAAGIAASVQAAAPTNGGSSKSGTRVLVIGGFGVEAVLAAKAGAQSVALLCEASPLGAELAAQLAADSGLPAGAIAAATSVDQLLAAEGEAQPGFDLVVLADALGSSISWQLLCRQLSTAAALLRCAGRDGSSTGGSGGGAPAVLPHAVRVRGQLVECAAAVALNEVDVEALRRDTGGLDFRQTNRLLPRASRSISLPTQPHSGLSSPATLLTVPLASMLAAACSPGSENGAAAAAAGSMSLEVAAGGSADGLAWWLEQQLLPGGSVANGSSNGTADSEAAGSRSSTLVLSSDPHSRSQQEAAFQPHVWQHVQYLDRRQLAAGQAVQVHCCLAAGACSGQAEDAGGALEQAVQALSLAPTENSDGASSSEWALQLDVSLAGGQAPAGSSSSTGSATSGSLLLPVAAEQAAVAAAVPRYHTAMLNDRARTAAYREGIAAALRQAEQRAGSGGESRLVLEIGSGSGLLCLLACQAGAARVIGCERLPELQVVAAQLLAANGAAGKVTVLPKHSKELTVAAAGQDGAALADGEAAAGNGNKCPAGQQADLPQRAALLVHEVFGSDPFSEGVVPTLLHAREHLLAPGALLAPCKLRVVAAVALSTAHHRLLRPPASVCGGAVVTRALRQLAPRKVDCQAGAAGASLRLLTEPAPVLELDLSSPELALAGSETAMLECLPRPLPLDAWVAAQRAPAGQQAAAGAAAGDEHVATAVKPLPANGARPSLVAVSWFEYDFPGGAAGSSGPHLQLTEHWQQVVQPLEGPAAEAALALPASIIQALWLTAGYRVDRLWFELAGLAAAAGSEEEESEEDGEGAP